MLQYATGTNASAYGANAVTMRNLLRYQGTNFEECWKKRSNAAWKVTLFTLAFFYILQHSHQQINFALSIFETPLRLPEPVLKSFHFFHVDLPATFSITILRTTVNSRPSVSTAQHQQSLREARSTATIEARCGTKIDKVGDADNLHTTVASSE